VTLEFGSEGRKVKLTRTPINGAASADYERVTERLLFDVPESEIETLPRQITDLQTVTFKLIDKSGAKSKIYVDDILVYLYGGPLGDGGHVVDSERAGDATRGDTLPLPPLPDGFRGTN
jgi:hypothetical protein